MLKKYYVLPQAAGGVDIDDTAEHHTCYLSQVLTRRRQQRGEYLGVVAAACANGCNLITVVGRIPTGALCLEREDKYREKINTVIQ